MENIIILSEEDFELYVPISMLGRFSMRLMEGYSYESPGYDFKHRCGFVVRVAKERLPVSRQVD